MRTDHGNMTECEIFSNLKVPCGSKVVVRADGRNFSRVSSNLGLEKPYDKSFVKNMVDASRLLFYEFSPAFVYTFSDEINILLCEVPFAGRVEKLDSVFASFLGSALTASLKDSYENLIKPISFDARVIPISSGKVVKYFRIRQNEAWRNCINGYVYWTLKKEYGKEKATKILKGKKSKQIHDILFDRGINIAEVPAWQRRGVGIYKKEVYVEGYNPISKENVLSKRKRIFVDWNLPLFDKEFFNLKNIRI